MLLESTLYPSSTSQKTLQQFCATVGVLLHWLLLKSRSCPVKKIHNPLGQKHLLAQHLCRHWVYCCDNGGCLCCACLRQKKPESKNPGGIPNVAVEVPLCPLFPVCQVPVLPLERLPGSPAGTCTWRKADPWCSCPWVSRPLQWFNTHSRYLQRICTSSRSIHQRWALWPCHVKHWGRPCVSDGPHLQKPSLLAHLQNLQCFTVVSGEVLGLIGAVPLIFTRSDLKKISSQTLTNKPLLIFHRSQQPFLASAPHPQDHWGSATMMKTRERRGSSFSQLGLEPNHTGLTAQSLFFLEESYRIKRSDTQTSSNFSNDFKRILKLQNVLPASPNKMSSSNSQITYKTPAK